MKILLSPSKTLHLTNETPGLSSPIFKAKQNEILTQLKKLNTMQLRTFFDISDKLAEKVNFMIHRYKKPYAAIGFYKGEAYRYLDAPSWNESTQQQAQDSLRILCAQHGFLRPYDTILPYRMDFLVSFENLGLPNSYTYWSAAVTNALENELLPGEFIFNLASKEFSSLINQSDINNKGHWINVDFHLIKKDEVKTVSMLAKKARGQMARALLENPIHTIEHLFDLKNIGDFILDEASSTTSYLRYTVEA
jgi:cytoplasmic iron level regulating protein YaaA (DUF328/UPF0246 family)